MISFSVAGLASFSLLAFTSLERDLEIIGSGMNDSDVFPLYRRTESDRRLLTIFDKVGMV
jgi:hypothetical protein